jgi:hypothetical protein
MRDLLKLPGGGDFGGTVPAANPAVFETPPAEPRSRRFAASSASVYVLSVARIAVHILT